MPLSTPVTQPTTTVEAFANVYHDRTANTIEFGARIYNTPDAARERALSRSIRSNLHYLGPISVSTPVSQEFILQGVERDASRFQAVRDQERLAREQREREESHEESESTDGDSAIQPGYNAGDDAI